MDTRILLGFRKRFHHDLSIADKCELDLREGAVLKTLGSPQKRSRARSAIAQLSLRQETFRNALVSQERNPSA